MKKAIQKWLGIKSDKYIEELILAKVGNSEELEKEILERTKEEILKSFKIIMDEIYSDKPWDDIYLENINNELHYSAAYLERHRSYVKNKLIDLLQFELEKAYDVQETRAIKHFEQIYNGEGFLDQIIERIKKKQVR